MKNLLLPLLLLFALSSSAQDLNSNFGLQRYAEANAKLAAPQPGEHRVVFMGNSITDGWPDARPEFFSENKFIGRGIGGQTSYQFLLRFRNDVVDLKPEVVVINYGTNDIAENTGPYDERQTFNNVKTMCDICRAHKIKVILASTLPHGAIPWRPSVTDAMLKVRSLNALVREYAAQQHIPYVDYFSAMVKADGSRMREELSHDGIHPNVEGYKIMESLVLPVIQKTIARGKGHKAQHGQKPQHKPHGNAHKGKPAHNKNFKGKHSSKGKSAQQHKKHSGKKNNQHKKQNKK